MSYPRIYNAAVDMVDRNVAEGRAIKAGLHRSQRDADLRRAGGPLQPHGQSARHLRHPARSARCPAAAGYGRFSGCVLGRDQGRRGAGALNTLLTAEQYAYILGDSRAKALFVSAPLLPVVQPILGKLPFLKHVFVVRRRGAPFALSFRGELQHPGSRSSSSPTPAATRRPSGSTRPARRACRKARATCTRARWKRRGCTDRAASASARTISSIRRPSCSSPTVSATPCRFRCRSAPPACCCRIGRRRRLVFRTLKQHQPTVFFGVPTLYAAMLAFPQGTPDNSSQRLRLCVSAGEALPAEVGQGLPRQVRRRHTGWRRLHRDAASVCLQQPGQGALRHLRQGRTRLRDPPGRRAGQGCSRRRSRRDAGARQQRRRRLLEPARQEPLHLRGRLDSLGRQVHSRRRGYYTYQGRTDDMFKVSGIWVSPFEVESALVSHDAVLEAAVVPKRTPTGC